MTQFGLLQTPGVCDAEDRARLMAQAKLYAQGLSQGLADGGFINEPCNFVITSRHVPLPGDPELTSKFSLHIVFLLLAEYQNLRLAMKQAKRFVASNAISNIVDPCVDNNNVGQYMQTIGSEKVSVDKLCNGQRFKYEGTFDPMGNLITPPSEVIILPSNSD